MKKLLYILFAVSIIFASCSKNEVIKPTCVDPLEPTDSTSAIQSVIVGNKWEGNVPNYGNIIFGLENNGTLNIYGFDVNCGYYFLDYLGDWILKGDTINYSYTSNNFEYTELFGIVIEYDSTEIKLFVNTTTSSICSILPTSADNSCTYIPDNNFEQVIIDLGLDDFIDDFVKTSAINTLTVLDLSGKNITNLTGIGDFIALTELNCFNNQLTSLDVTNNTALTSLYCGSNLLTSLDVTNNTALIYLNVSFQNESIEPHPQFQNLDLSSNTALMTLNCEYNYLTSLDVTNNTALTSLYCGSNSLTSLDVTNNTALTSLYCEQAQLTNIDVSNNIALEKLLCYTNKLTSLDVSNNIALMTLNCEYNFLTSLDVRNGNNLNLTIFNSSNNSNLTCINVDDAAWSTTNWTSIDNQSFFSEDCGIK